jgi:hypothetical protein
MSKGGKMKNRIGPMSALAVVLAVSLSACAPKTESEKLQDQMKKAQKQMSSDMNKAGKQMKREADSWK